MTEQFSFNTSPSSSLPLRTGLAWFLIFTTVALTLISSGNGTVPDNEESSPRSQNRNPPLQILITGKYIVGIHHLLGQNPVFRDNNKPPKQLLAQLLETHKKIEDRIMLTPIIAELSGVEEAIFELNRIAKNPGSAIFEQDVNLFLQLYQYGVSSLSQQQRQSIVENYGWIGRLALIHEFENSSPERKMVLQSAIRVVILLLSLIIGIMFSLCAGTVLLVLAVAFKIKGRLQSRFICPEIPRVLLLEAFAIYLTAYGALPLLIGWFFPRFRPGAIAISLLGVIVGAFWPKFRGLDWKSYRESIGWLRGRGFFREVGAGITGYIAGLPLLAIAAILVSFLSRYTEKTPSHPIVQELGGNPAVVTALFFLACVWAPIIEETFFRGAIFGYLRGRFKWVISSIVTSIIFAALHPQGLVAVPLLAMIGFNLCAIREWRNSLIASMSAHALNNGSVFLLIILLLR